VVDIVVRRAQAADDMNVCTLKGDIWPNHTVFWVRIDSDKGTKLEGVIRLDRC
jgi:hypothetical protein